MGIEQQTEAYPRTSDIPNVGTVAHCRVQGGECAVFACVGSAGDGRRPTSLDARQ